MASSPWLARFLSLGKICMSKIHMSKVINDQGENPTSQGPGVQISENCRRSEFRLSVVLPHDISTEQK
jgi:hypothetical protein